MTYISSTYDGEWKNDVPCGLGELKYNDNEVSVGAKYYYFSSAD